MFAKTVRPWILLGTSLGCLSAISACSVRDSRNDGQPIQRSTSASALTATDDFFGTMRWQPVQLMAEDLLANDPPGVTLVAVEQPAALGHTRMQTADGVTRVLWYLPANYAWPAGVSRQQSQFRYRIRDAAGQEALGTVTVEVENDSPRSNVPRVFDDTFTTDWDTTIEVDVMANDVRQPAAGTHIVIGTDITGTRGQVELAAFDTRIRYVPPAGYTGPDTFLYSLGYSCSCLPGGDCDQVCQPSNVWALVTIDVTAGTRQPGAAADAFSAGEGDALTVPAPGVLSNDRAPENRTLTALVRSAPAHGTLALSANGAFTYTPTTGYFGPDAFTYAAQDSTGWTSQATVDLMVIRNRPPVASNDTYLVEEDGVLAVAAPGVLSNDVDAEGERLTASLVTSPANGTLQLNADGSFTYRPRTNYFGADTFTYAAHDGHGHSSEATVSISVASVHDGVVAVGDAYSLVQGTALTVGAPGVLGNDVPGDSTMLTAELVSAPARGTLTLNANGAFVYTPQANFFGADSFVYRANDGLVRSTATVQLTVSEGNNTPVVTGDAYSAVGGQLLTVAVPGVLANDSDPRGRPLTVTLGRAPMSGTVQLSTNGAFTYRPHPGFSGMDSFAYVAANDLRQASGTVVLSVAANRAPAVGADAYSVAEDSVLTVASPGVLTNDRDPDGDAMTARLVTSTTNGVLSLRTEGGFTYTPNANYNGTDRFTYEARDAVGNTTQGTVTLTVTSVFDAASAVADAYTIAEDGVLTIAAPGVLGNDVVGDSTALTAQLVTGPAQGALELSANGSFSYRPNANYFGVDSFVYRAVDSMGGRTQATVTLTVAPVNDAPIGVPDTYSGWDGQTLNVPAPGVLANDTDVERDTLSASIVTAPTHGRVSLAMNGSFAYTPNSGFSGRDSFAYVATDSAGAASGPATVTIEVVLRAPVGLLLDDDARADMTRWIGTLGRKQSSRQSTLLLPDFAFNVGAQVVVSTGWLGDEGFFALKVSPGGTFPRRRCARVNQWGTDVVDEDRDYHFGKLNRVRLGTAPTTPLATDDYAERGYADSNKGRNDCQTGSDRHSYESVRDVTPLRATSLKALEGRRVCAVALGGKIHVNYGVLSSDLRGENVGTVAFRVLSVFRNASTPRTLPDMRIEILPLTESCAAGGFDPFLSAPVPNTPSDPWDVVP